MTAQLALGIPGVLDILQPERAVQVTWGFCRQRSGVKNARFKPLQTHRHEPALAVCRMRRGCLLMPDNDAQANQAIAEETAGLIGVQEGGVWGELGCQATSNVEVHLAIVASCLQVDLGACFGDAETRVVQSVAWSAGGEQGVEAGRCVAPNDVRPVARTLFWVVNDMQVVHRELGALPRGAAETHSQVTATSQEDTAKRMSGHGAQFHRRW